MFDFIKARIIGVTVPVVPEIPDSEGLVSYMARVSNESNQTNFDTAAGLLNYCLRENHVSVFETANIVMEIEVPRDISRQILRHRSFSFQELSQRYAVIGNFIQREARLQDTKNRQNSIPLDRKTEEDNELHHWWEDQQEYLLHEIQQVYDAAIEQGIAKEVARTILPEGLTMSKMYMNGTVRSWLHYCAVRDGHGTQLEHTDLAQKCKKEIIKYFPVLEKVMNKEA